MAQAIIGNYAVPILEEKPVWGTTDETRTAYLDTQVGGCTYLWTQCTAARNDAAQIAAQHCRLPSVGESEPCVHALPLCPQDVARMVMAALRSDAAVGRTLPLAGPKAWSTEEVIALCEKLADCDAEVGGGRDVGLLATGGGWQTAGAWVAAAGAVCSSGSCWLASSTEAQLGLPCPRGSKALVPHLPPSSLQVRNVPVWLLKGTRSLLRSFQWATDAADRLAFAEVLSSNETFAADMSEHEGSGSAWW